MKKSLKIFGLAALGAAMMFAACAEDNDPLANAIDAFTSGCVVTSFNGQQMPDQTYACTTPMAETACSGLEGTYQACPEGSFKECTRTGNTVFYYFTGPVAQLPGMSGLIPCPEGYEEKGGQGGKSSNSGGGGSSSSQGGGGGSSDSHSEVYGGCYYDESEEGYDFGSCYQPVSKSSCEDDEEDPGVFEPNYCPEHWAFDCGGGVFLYGDDAEQSTCEYYEYE